MTKDTFTRTQVENIIDMVYDYYRIDKLDKLICLISHKHYPTYQKLVSSIATYHTYTPKTTPEELQMLIKIIYEKNKKTNIR